MIVNLYGKAASEYFNNDTMDAFKNATVAMAVDYCTEQNISLTDNVTYVPKTV